jgi:predicted RNA-binding Zn-ribbon protein involved in translation (DUF1610 family)
VVLNRWARYRNRPGMCSTCGYDISSIRAGAACPECGHGNVIR